MIITLIAALAQDGCIGRNGTLPWRLTGDLRRFRELTTGFPVVMGRKTWDSLPSRPLPNRTNIVISRSSDTASEAMLAHSMKEATDIARQTGKNECFVIGGGEIYTLALAEADRLLLTRVHATVDGGDAFFPEWKTSEWTLVSSEPVPVNPGGPEATYEEYKRILP